MKKSHYTRKIRKNCVQFLICTCLLIIGKSSDLFAVATTTNCGTAAAQQLTVGTSCSSVAYTGINTAIGTPSLTGTCASSTIGDGWLWFNATATTTTIIATTDGALQDIAIVVYSGVSCATTLVGCVNSVGSGGTETIVLSTSAGTQYYVRLVRMNNGIIGIGASSSGAICVYSPPPAPANDNCAGAITLIQNATCVTTAGTNVGATQTLAPSTCSGFTSSSALDVWYQFVAVSTNPTIQVTGSFDEVLELRSGACNGTFVSCVDATGTSETLTTSGLTIGATYRIRVYGYAGATGTFNICVFGVVPPPPPSNDNCPGTLITQNIICVTTSGTTLNALQTIAPSSCSGFTSTSALDVWYQFVAVSTNPTIQVTGSGGMDPVVELRSGACNGASVTCMDATGINQTETILATGLTIGTTYLVRVYNYNGSGGGVPGPFAICVFGAPPPTNDACSGAIAVSCGSSVSGNTSSATDDTGFPAFPGSGTGNNFKGVWHKITLSTQGIVTLSLCTGTSWDSYMRVFSGTCGSLTCIAEDDDFCSSFGASQATTPVLTAGTYYVLLSGFSSSEFGVYTLTATCQLCSTPPSGGTASGPSTGCTNQNLTYNVSGGSGGYQWQYSTTGAAGPFTDIAGQTGASMTNSASVIGTYYIVCKRTSAGCASALSNVITTVVGQGGGVITPTSNTTAACPGGTIDLNATASGGGYSITTPSFGTVASTGTSISLSDDGVSSALPIGFNFNFYGNNYSQFYIGANGFITFNAGSGGGCCSGGVLGTNDAVNNVIAFAWSDLDPTLGNGTIKYYTTGSAPNRSLVVSFNGISHYTTNLINILLNIPFNPITTQVVLFETSNIIKINTTSMPSDGNNHTMGFENANGSIFNAVPGRNSQNWSASNESQVGTPLPSYTSYSWSGPNGYSFSGQNPPPITNFQPVNAGTYTITGTTATGCQGNGTINISTNPAPAATSDNDGPVCVGGTIALSSNGGAGFIPSASPPPFQWSGPGFSSTNQNPLVTGITSGGSGNYTVTITNSNGCSATATTYVTVNSLPVLTATTTTDAQCIGGSDGEVILGGSGSGGGPYTIGDGSSSFPSVYSATFSGLSDGGTYTFYILDENTNCENLVNVNIGHNDTQPPTIVSPGDVIVSNTPGLCEGIASWVAPVGIDNCVSTTVQTEGPASGSSFPVGTTAITYTVTDEGNNSATCSFNVIVNDAEAPTWTTPATSLNATLQCSDAGGIAMAQALFPIANDNCDQNVANIVKVSGSFIQGFCPEAGSYTNTWTVMDDNNNTSSHFTQVITIIDNTAPTFTRPANATLYKDANCQVNDTPTGPAGDVTNESDNCAAGLNATYTDAVTNNCEGTYTITRTWSLVDNCDNAAASQVQTITVLDNIAPSFTKPANATLYKDANCQVNDTPAGAAGDVTNESDNCSTGLNATYSDAVTNNCEGTYTITRTWSLVDNCGNAAASQVQTITVLDDIAPSFTKPANATLYKDANCNVNDTPAGAAGDVTNESDNCSTGLNATYSDAVTNNCEGTYTITRTWSLVDNCGNAAASQVQTITVLDDIAPSFTKPANATLYKDANCQVNDTPAGAAGDVTNESDNCSTGLNATYSDAVTNNCEGTYTITRTWSLVDNCGNAAVDQVQTITVLDNIAPSFTKPANVTLYKDANCNVNDTPAGAAGDVTNESDNCSTGLNATYSDAVTNNCEGTYTITRTWSLVDNCGNAAASQVQTITVLDNIAPSFTKPANVTLYKDANCQVNDTPAGAAGDVTNESDNCSTGLNATYSDAVTNNCEGTYTITRTWSLVDNCGNAAVDQVQTITVLDDIAPSFTKPANATLYKDANCNVNDTPAGAAGDVTNESDNCSTGLNATYSDAVTNNCEGTYTITRTWSLVDNCGNAAVDQVQTITVLDNIAPSFTKPANVTLYKDANCNVNDTPAGAAGDVTNESDNCSTGLNATYSDAVTNNCEGTYTITRTWSLVDNCGNAAASQVQTITVLDNIAPSFTKPANVTLYKDANCNVNDTPAGAAGDVTNESDNCSTGLNATYSDAVTNNCEGTYTITRTWSLVDNCGNAAASQVQTITVLDDIAPSFTKPANATLYKDANCNVNDTPAGAAGDVTNESDNCSTGLNATYSDAVTNNCEGTYTITRTWSLVDNCGNAAASQVQTITVLDDIAPSFTKPANATLYKDANCNVNDTPAGAAGDVTNESDNCSTGLNATYSDAVTNNCEGTYTITRTWSLVDNCGNAAASQVQTITVLDNIAPTFTRPADITIYTNASCGYDISLGNTGDVTNESDNCSTGIQATHSDVIVNGSCDGTHVVTRTWSLVDNCGNAAANQIQTIHVEDNTAPNTVCQNITIYLNSSGSSSITPAMINNGSSDNCSGTSLTLGVSKTAFDCSNLGANTVTLTATDDCGNSSTCTATVTVIDNIAPTISCPANMLNIPNDPNHCYAVVTYATPAGADNCPVTTLQTAGLPSGSQFPVGVTTNTFVVTDASGNSATCSFNIIVGDVQNPTITCPPLVVVNSDPGFCYATGVNLGTPVTGDNCAVQGVTNNAPAQYPVGATIVDWEVEDINGNKTQCQQFVIVQDNELPVIHNMPANITFTADPTDCYPAITWAAPNATDNCTIDWFTSNYQSGDEFPEGTTTVIYTAMDINGNSSTASFTVTILTQPLVATISSPVFNCGYNVSCNGLTNGQAIATINGGCLPYTVSWSNGNAGLTHIFNLGAGTYTIYITDDNGHTTSANVTLTQPPVLTTTLGADQSFEFACTCVDLVASGAATAGGCAPYTYAWSTSATTSQINVCPGQTTSYTVTVTDNNGCTASDVIQVIKPALVAQLDRYVLMGLGTLNDDFGNNTNVHTGAVGHRGSTGKVVLGNNGIITEWLASNSVQIGNNNHVGTLYRNTATIGSGNNIGITITPVTIPVTTKVPCFPVFSGGSNVTVGGTPVTLSPGTYNNVTLGNGSILNLNPGVYQFNLLSTGNNASILPVSPSTAKDVMIFVKTTATFGNNNIVKSNIYSKLDMNIGNNNNGEYRGAFYSGTRFLTGNNGHFYLDTYCFSNLPLCNSREDVTGIIQQTSMLNLFPNPNSGTFTIQYTGQTGNTINISVLNMLGQVLYERKVMEFMGEMEQQIDMNTLPPGMYFIQLSNGDEITNKQFVITR